MQTIKVKRPAKSMDFMPHIIHIGTILSLSQARKKIRTPSGLKLQCEVEKESRLKEVSARWCKHCYKELLPKQMVFCSIKCLAVNHAHKPINRKKREKPVLNLVLCKNTSCAKEFMQRSRGQESCSKSCSAKLSNIKRRENNEMHKL